ncbi:hypothetical protein Hanom_Chr17g01527871 [Helianthus anomalus]
MLKYAKHVICMLYFFLLEIVNKKQRILLHSVCIKTTIHTSDLLLLLIVLKIL